MSRGGGGRGRTTVLAPVAMKGSAPCDMVAVGVCINVRQGWVRSGRREREKGGQEISRRSGSDEKEERRKSRRTSLKDSSKDDAKDVETGLGNADDQTTARYTTLPSSSTLFLRLSLNRPVSSKPLLETAVAVESAIRVGSTVTRARSPPE